MPTVIFGDTGVAAGVAAGAATGVGVPPDGPVPPKGVGGIGFGGVTAGVDVHTSPIVCAAQAGWRCATCAGVNGPAGVAGAASAATAC